MILVPIFISNAIQNNVMSSSQADTVRQNRQQRFGIRAFQGKSNNTKIQRKKAETQIAPSDAQIYGPARVRFGIDRHNDTTLSGQNRLDQKADGTNSIRRSTDRQTGTTSYKQQVRKLKGREYSPNQ